MPCYVGICQVNIHYSWRETGAVPITRREASTEYDPCWPGKVFLPHCTGHTSPYSFTYTGCIPWRSSSRGIIVLRYRRGYIAGLPPPPAAAAAASYPIYSIHLSMDGIPYSHRIQKSLPNEEKNMVKILLSSYLSIRYFFLQKPNLWTNNFV